MFCFLTGILIFLAAGLITFFVSDKRKGTVFTSVSVVAFIMILPQIFSSLIYGNTESIVLNFNYPIGPVSFVVDPLAAFFMLIIAAGALLASIYSAGYMKHYDAVRYSLSSFYFFMGLLTAAMLTVAAVQNAVLFLIAWEIMSVSSFFLVIFESDKPDVRQAGLYYLIAMQIGASFLIASFAWVSNLSGSYDFESFRNILSSKNYIAVILFVLFFIGFGTKAGFVPFHTWLPKAHPAAPTGVSAIMSGVMIKTGIYGILRIILLSGTTNTGLAYTVFIMGLVTGITGIINSVSQKDIKKMLAYSSIENIGIIGMGIGLGMLGTDYNLPAVAALGYLGAVLHVLNHFIFKSLLFYGSGIVYQNTGTKNMEKLGGLIKYMPYTSVLFLIGSLAISGLPLFNGFIGEFAIYLGMVKGFVSSDIMFNTLMLVGFSGLALIGIIVMLGFTKLFGIVFLGTPREKFSEPPAEGSALLVIPMAAMAVFIFIIGLFPLPSIKILSVVVRQFILNGVTGELNSVYSTFSSLTEAFLLFGGIILFFLAVRQFLLRKKNVRIFKTWDCGYQAESSRMQYTGSSFSFSFLELVAEFVPQKTIIEGKSEIFPVSAELKTTQHDLAERIIIQPVIHAVRKFLKLFSWIQSGRMQQYILYGLIFLIIILIWVIGLK